MLEALSGDWKQVEKARILFTGATGFVGKWLLEAFVDANRQLGLKASAVAVSRDPAKFAQASPHLTGGGDIEWIRADVRQLPADLGAFDYVICGATDVANAASAPELFETCVTGTWRVLARARQAQAALLVSSGAAYGPQPADQPSLAEDRFHGFDPSQPASAYAEAKRASEVIAAHAAREHGVAVKTARLFAFVGPYLPLDRHFAIGNFIRAALGAGPILVDSDGRSIRSYLYGADLAVWLWRILLRGRPGRAYNVGGDRAVSIAELAALVAKVCRPGTEVRLKDAETPFSRYVPDTSRTRTELGLAETVPLEEAIARTADWHRGAAE